MRLLNRIADSSVVALFVATLLLVNVQIVFRFVLSISVPWTEEVSRLLFVWLAYLGAAIGHREGTLIAIDTLPQMIDARARAWLAPIVTLVSVAVILFLFGASIPMVMSVWPTTLATVDWISHGWAYLAFTVGFGLMLVHSVVPLMRGLHVRSAVPR